MRRLQKIVKAHQNLKGFITLFLCLILLGLPVYFISTDVGMFETLEYSLTGNFITGAAIGTGLVDVGKNSSLGFTMKIIGAESKEDRSLQGFSSSNEIWPNNWIFPFGIKPHITSNEDYFHFVCNGKQNDDGELIWYGINVETPTNSGTSPF